MRKVFYLIFIMLLIFCIACSDKNSSTTEIENAKPVMITELKSETFPISLEYIGTIQSKSLKKYSFKSSGKIAALPIVNGQSIKKGDILAKLDITELNLAMDAAKAQMNAAKALYDKATNGASEEEVTQAKLGVKNAKNVYDFALKTYEDVKTLYDTGSVSKQQLDETKLQLDSSETNLKLSEGILSQTLNGIRDEDRQAAYAQYQQAKAGYEVQASLVNDAQLEADVDGYVIDILNEVGEITAAGYPVVIVSTNEQIVNVGLSQQDIKKVDIGTEVFVEIDETKIKGLVSSIDNAIDAQSRTYNVEVTIDDSYKNLDILLGSIVKVSFLIGDKNGIWISIPYISNDGEDYVYVVEDDRVVRKNIILKNMYQYKVLVEGLKDGDALITKGFKNIKEGYKITIQE